MLLALLAVIAIVWLLIAQPWRGSAAVADRSAPAAHVVATTPSDTARSTPTTTTAPVVTTPPATAPAPSPGPTQASPAATAAPCRSSAITVQAATDQSTYAAGQNPKLSISLTNTGATPCTFDVGTATQVFTVTSGSDTWWRSTDCQTKPSDMLVLLAAGQTVKTAQPVVWDRTRSSVSSCAATNRQKAPGHGSSYHLSVAIGGVSSRGNVQFILY